MAAKKANASKKHPKLRIHFSGLCGFVPLGAEPNPPVDVLLVNTNLQSHASLLRKMPEPHFPLLKFNLANLVGAQDLQGPTEAMWALNAETIEVAIVEGEAVSVLEGGVELVGPERGELQSFKCVPSINEVLPGEGDINPRAFKLAPPSIAVAKFKLRGGELSTVEVGSFKGRPVTAQFVPPPASAGVRQVLAHTVQYVLDIKEGADVIMTARSEAGKVRRARLTPKKIKGEWVILIEVTNLCCGFYLEKAGQDESEPSTDGDFEYFYMLCKDFLKTKKVRGAERPFKGKYTCLPVPAPVEYLLEVPKNPTGEGGGLDPIRCTMARFNSYLGKGA